MRQSLKETEENTNFPILEDPLSYARKHFFLSKGKQTKRGSWTRPGLDGGPPWLVPWSGSRLGWWCCVSGFGEGQGQWSFWTLLCRCRRPPHALSFSSSSGGGSCESQRLFCWRKPHCTCHKSVVSRSPLLSWGRAARDTGLVTTSILFCRLFKSR